MATLPDRDDWFEFDHDLPHARWWLVDGWIRAMLPRAEAAPAWNQAVKQWLTRLGRCLGPAFRVTESERFFLLSSLDEKTAHRRHAFLETSGQTIHRTLGADLTPPDALGKYVVLQFASHEDYYRYIAHFYPDGSFAGSGGVFIQHGGYLHIALPPAYRPDEAQASMIHELVHNLLAFLPLPAWLNEALAMSFESELAGGPAFFLDEDLIARHRAYWTAETIQGFWQGNSFQEPEGQEVSYSLARIMLRLIHADVRPAAQAFRRFVLGADWHDAGEVALREHLGCELADLAATFLGPGEWAPRPEQWKKEEADRSPELDEELAENFPEEERAS